MPLSPSFKIERTNENIHRQLVLLLKQQIKDPRLQTVTITDVLTSRDLTIARVFYTVPPSTSHDITLLLQKTSGFFRAKLSKKLNLRHMPKLKFVFDPAPNIGARMDDILSQL